MNLPIDSFITTLSYFLLRKGQNKNFYLELLTAQSPAGKQTLFALSPVVERRA